MIKMINNNYVVYHLHDECSLLDSCTNYKLYVDKAVELGQKAICFTNHGNIYNWYEKKMYCDKNEIKYMHGIECYLTESLEEKERDNYHTILIARNLDGMHELNNLFFISTKEDHFYYKPRLSFDEFLNISDNIIKISACIASPLEQYKNKIIELRNQGINVDDKMNKYIQLCKHYDYYEIQYHNFLEQIEYNKYLYKISKQYNKPLIAGTDTHAVNKYKQECRTMLQYGKEIVFTNEDKCDLSYKSYEELVEKFKEQDSLPINIVLDAINNTNIMADSVEELNIDTSVKYPILYKDRDEEQVMWDTLRKKYKYKLDNNIITNNQQYIDNIKEEMRVFKKINMVGFMLFMSELMTWCRENGIPTSPCRGSVGGSTVAYISDIIDVDPIKWNTVFSRFANEDRQEVGDVDVDVYEDQRQLVYDYIINRFGKEKTGFILAMSTVVDKGVIDLLGKAFRKKAELNGTTTIYTLSKIKEIKEEFTLNPNNTKEKYPDLFYYFDGLLNTVVAQSQHPAGIIASPINLIDNYGMFVGSDGQYIIPINMEEVHEIGLVKYDILGLKNIGIIRKTCEYANIKYPLSHEINWKDQKVFKDMLTSPIGIFQFEGDYAFSLLKKFNTSSIDDMSLVNASLRPSGESYRDNLIARIPHKNPSKIIDDLLSANNGYLVYQEDTIKFLKDICGLSGSEADNVRRAIGRKQVDRLQKALPQILEGYCKMSDQPRDIAEKEAKEFLQIIEDSSNYQFGYNHSTGYSMLGYLCAYMRYYYPVEFCTAFLNCSKTEEDIYNGTMLAKQKGIKIKMPKFRESGNEFTCNAKDMIIYKGIGSIKDIGKKCGTNLYSLKDNKYNSFIELLNDIKSNSFANKTELEILTKIGFFEEFGDINLLLKETEYFNSFIKRKTLKRKEVEELGIDIEEVSKLSEKTTEKQFSNVDMIKVLELICKNIEYKPTTNLEVIKYQIQLLGYTNIIDNSISEDIYIVEQQETNNYGTPFVSLYHPYDGNSLQNIKVDRKWFNEYKCKVGDVLRCSFKDKPKKRKNENGKWYDTGEIEHILNIYSII